MKATQLKFKIKIPLQLFRRDAMTGLRALMYLRIDKINLRAFNFELRKTELF